MAEEELACVWRWLSLIDWYICVLLSFDSPLEVVDAANMAQFLRIIMPNLHSYPTTANTALHTQVGRNGFSHKFEGQAKGVRITSVHE